MSKLKDIVQKFYSELILFAILFLFFFQTLSDLVETIYGFALLNLEPDENIAGLAFLLTPLFIAIPWKRMMFLVFKKFMNAEQLKKYGSKTSERAFDKILITLGGLMILSRLLDPILKRQGILITSGLAVGCFLIFFPIYLTRRRNDEKKTSMTLGYSLAIAVAFSILFRALNSSIDISMYGWYQVIGWIMGIIAGVMLFGMKLRGDTQKVAKEELVEASKSAGFGKILALSFGLVSVFIIIWFTFVSPTVVSRWTDGNYIGITLGILGVLCLFVISHLFKIDLLGRLKTWMIWVWNGVFSISLFLTVIVHQLSFPDDSALYPILDPQPGWFYQIPLVIMILLSPIIYVDFMLLSRDIVKAKPSKTTIGGSFIISGSLYIIVMIFVQILPNIWGYLEPISTGFRDKYWLAFFIPGLILTLSVLLVKQKSLNFEKLYKDKRRNLSVIILLSTIFLGTLAGTLITKPYPNYPTAGKTSLTIMTYNIQQGRNVTGDRNYDGQLDLIRQVDPDILGLQECDPTRISGGNLDVVRYFAEKLNMYSYYGPNTVTNTYGCAILSKFPISDPLSFFMFSDEEQIGSAQAKVTLDSTIFNVFVNHPSGANYTKFLQVQQMLTQVDGLSNVIFMGDFNFRKDSAQYSITTEKLNDSWMLKWPSGLDDQSYNSTNNIDHIFVSPGTVVLDARYIISDHSDHPAYWIRISL
jgi:endonuclease/exonuclease/phosphatase family metal-dependent hydrolase